MRIKEGKYEVDSLDHCFSCQSKEECLLLKTIAKLTKEGVLIITIQFCENGG